MTLGYDPQVLEDQLTALDAYIGSEAILRVYDGARPATGAAITTQTLLIEWQFTAGFADTITGATLTANLPDPVNATASGDATWFRLVQDDGSTFVLDGDASLPGQGGDLELVPTAVVMGEQQEIQSLTITRGNQ